MISGSAKVRMDDKGRLAIPNRFRQVFADSSGLVLTYHPHRHLMLYPLEVYARVEQQLLAMPNIGYMESHLLETVIGCAEEVQLDSAGRIMVQSHLRARAGIEREVLFFCISEKIHIWDEKAWEQRNTLMLSRLQDGGLSEQWQNLKL